MGLGLMPWMLGVHPSPLVRVWVGLVMMGVHWSPLRIGWMRVPVMMDCSVRKLRCNLWHINDMVHLATIMT